MAKNISEKSIKNSLVNAINEQKKRSKENRTNQLYPLGFFPLPQSDSAIETNPDIPDGSIYYATDLFVNRKKENGVWSNM